MINLPELKERSAKAWRRVDGPLALISYGGTMLFLGYVVATWQGAAERQALTARVDSVRASVTQACLEKTSTTVQELSQQKLLVQSLVGSVHDLTEQTAGLRKQTDTIARKQASSAAVRKQETETVARKAATLAASEAVTQLNTTTREKINKAVQGKK